jgi:hypothetical protein
MAERKNMKQIEVGIQGVSPYLMHRFGGTDASELDNARGKRSVGAPDYSLEAEKALYKNEQGIYVPSRQVEASMIKASSNFQIPGKGKKTFKDLLKGFVFIEEPELIMNPQKYEVDIQAVRIQRARIVRYRPIFREWTLKFHINIQEENEIPDKIVQDILTHAGQYVGIGDYRPRYGRFRVTKFQENGKGV